jgi:Lactoylglutathione lyase and related lyases
VLGYVTIGVNDMDKAIQFYDGLLSEIGARQLFGQDLIKFYSTGPEKSMITICLPYDENAPASRNGNMITIPGGSREGVHKLYSKAMELGASDKREPGKRLPVFYGAYVRDLDGNKLCFYEMKM